MEPVRVCALSLNAEVVIVHLKACQKISQLADREVGVSFSVIIVVELVDSLASLGSFVYVSTFAIH